MWVKKNCLGLQKFLPVTQSVTAGFYKQELWGLIFLALEPWAGGHGEGLGLLNAKISLQNFYPYGFGPAHPASAPLLPVWMYVVSLILRLSGFHSTRFLMV